MDADNYINPSHLTKFGRDEIVLVTTTRVTFSNFPTHPEPSTSSSTAQAEEGNVNGSTATEGLASSPPSAVQIAPDAAPSRAKIIPKAEWERFRPIIEEMYVTQDLKLSTLREITALGKS
jgi:hypothetical protein